MYKGPLIHNLLCSEFVELTLNKLHYLGIDYVVRRSTLAEANKRRPQEFFANVYAYLLARYSSFLADKPPERGTKT